MKLTEETIENAQYEGHFSVGKNGRKRWSLHIVWDDDLPALGVRISSRGQKSYVGAHRSGGRKQTKTLGKVGDMTIEEARWRAVELDLEPSAPQTGAAEAPAATPRAQAMASQAPAVATEAQEAPRQESRPAVASEGPNAMLAAALDRSMRQRAELADRLEEAARRGAEATEELEDLRAAHQELEAEFEAERERFERQRAEWESRAKKPDAWPVEARRTADNLRQSVDQLMTSLKESESAREELSRRLEASSEKEQARARKVAALTRERELQEAELERARTRARGRNVVPIALSALAGAILGALLTLFLPASPETRPSPDPGTESGAVASGPTGEEAATRPPEPNPAPAAPPRAEADPASGSTESVALVEIEAPAAEAAEPDVSAAEPDVSAAEETLEAWAAAWSGQRVDDYLSFYSSEFRPPGGMERGAWESQRRTRILRPRTISVSLGTMSSTVLEPGRVRVVFDQAYQTESYRDEVRKTIELAWEDDRWRIAGERSD